MDGECLPAEAACGTGTVYDAMARTCVSALACAEGTTRMGDECVADGSVFCGGNTIFDAESGTCVPDPEALCEGDLVFVLETATCVDPDELLGDLADVRELAEPNDPAFNDLAMAQAVDVADGSGSFYGCVEPQDFDDDGVLDIDNDVFSVEVDGPTLLRVRTDGIRGANAAVAFFSGEMEGPLVDAGWQRLVVGLSGDGQDQKIFLPAAGTYFILATDARSLFFGEPAGGMGQCYFVQLDVEELPAPRTVTPGTPITGDFDEPRFFSIEGSRGQLLFTNVSELDASGSPFDRESTASAQVTLVDRVVRSAVDESSGVVQDAVIGLDAGDTVWFVVDKVYDLALDTTDFALLVEDAGAVELPEDGSIDVTHDAALFRWGFFDATAGDVIHLQATPPSGDTLSTFRVFEPSGGGVAICNTCTAVDGYVQIATTGVHYVQWFNSSATEGETYALGIERDAITPSAMTAGTPASASLAAHDRAFFTADLRTAEWIAWSVDDLVNATSVRLSLHARDQFGVVGVGLLSASDSGTLGPAVLERILRDGGEQVLVSVTDAGEVTNDETFDLLLSNVDYVDLGTLTPAMGAMRMGETAPADLEPVRYLLEAEDLSTATLTTSTAVGTLDSVIEIVDTDLDVLATFDTTGAGADESGERLVRGGWVAFLVADASGVGGAYDLTISVTPPPYSRALGSLPFASVCPSEGGSGTVLPLTSDDDGLSTMPITIPGDFPFLFFGAGVSEATVSSNGWLTFTPSYAGGNSAGSARNAIAPMAADLDLVEVCTERDGTRWTIEWRGELWLFGDAIQMQAVLHEDGRIDLIYGPGHEAATGFTGLINTDNSLRLGVTELASFPSSVTFTPNL